MDELDNMFARIQAEPVPAALETLGEAVMAGVDRKRERFGARMSMGLACVVAASVGLWGGLTGLSTAHAHGRPLLAVPEAAPSHLLGS
ncbi:hypothetical protein GR702_11310 [Novosphingobium sp. FGD1]|uniref:Uncharacterized protein n=1 Tax=Novosphingobium silvae TaxID=2692619 RepID=A0A7X4GGR7_9SPHN|nr:hypothetical protein [Novosphingobium silvae]MYL98351.1 hypothetical protein [Novosphingobium silvae]